MIRKFAVLLLVLAGWTLGLFAYEWTNLTPENRLGGRMVSAGYLRGKVVVLDCRDYGDKANFADIRALQQLWACYKTKPFVIIGSHRGKQDPKRMAAILDRLGVTYPVYAQAELKGISTATVPCLYVMDSTCTVRLYAGSAVRSVNGCVGNAIFSACRPAAAKQWKRLLDFELTNLPGQAYLHLKSLLAQKDCLEEVRRTYPDDLRAWMAAYEKAKASDEIKKLAKLVELATLVKDRDTQAKESKKITKAVINKNIEKFEALKESANPFVVQEAKNALADLKFVEATLSK